MSNTVISVDQLSKAYRLGQISTGTLTRDLNVWWAKVRGNPVLKIGDTDHGNRDGETIWALKEVSFSVEQGEALGIVGRNGAGKSTLLKILSEVTAPTSGEVKVKGRIASLLEVGTGFHPDLTGRENVYMNGAILGMSRQEIRHKFDEIINFAEIEQFIDTPVKRYSSGMYVRLAFAVAAHLDPEILVVDEVLAVGDAQFQKKCLGKMGNAAQEGRTVLFVSHNMIAIQSLCRHAIWLDKGHVVEEGEVVQVVSDYLRLNASTTTEQIWDDIATAPGNDIVRLHRICVRPEDASSSGRITMDTPLVLELELWNLLPGIHLNTNFHLITENQVVAFSVGSNSNQEWRGRPWPVGLIKHVCHIPGNLLNSGYHGFSLLVVKDRSEIIFQLKEAVSFLVQDVTKQDEGWFGKSSGVVRPRLKWDITQVDSTLPNHADMVI
jgi:lipopolysaccharide transport system ATP-binding protein